MTEKIGIPFMEQIGGGNSVRAIPEAFDTRDALVETIARDTLSWYSRQKEGCIRTEQS